MKKRIVSIFIFLSLVNSYAINIDSLKNNIENAQHDSIKVINYIEWDLSIYDQELDKKLSEKIKSICLKNLKKVISAQEKYFFKSNLAWAYNSLALHYENLGNHPLALDHHFKALAIRKEINNLKGIASSCNNIGILYTNIGQTEKALKYFNKSVKLNESLKIESALSENFNNISLLYIKKKDFKSALKFIDKSIDLDEKNNDYLSLAYSYNNKASICNSLNMPKMAISYYEKSLKISTENNDYLNMISSYLNLGKLYSTGINSDYDKSLRYFNKTLALLKVYPNKEALMKCYAGMHDTYKFQHKFKEALNYYFLSEKVEDEIESNEINKAIYENEINFEYQTQKVKDSLSFEKEKFIKNSELSAKKNQQLMLMCILLVVLIFLYIIYKRFKTTKKQKEIIELAHTELGHKNREILDSITYAKRIQSAILPQPKLVKEFLEDSFVLYKPKDIVAGDFYWLEVVDDTVLFAAADCTGHGVPGAMVSVVCNNGLNRAVREYGLKEPNEILDKTRELVVEEFEKSDEEVKDGMDISLCALNTKTNILRWAGANNPLWILRKNELGLVEMIEAKPDKQPIGKYTDEKPFSLKEFKLKKNDIIYIFTDGFQDQFGGSKEKKYRASQMRELFLSIYNKSMEEQRKIIDASFEDWKGELEQVDDVCIIGVRI